MGGAEKRILAEVSSECGLHPGLLVELMDVERKYHGMNRRAGVYTHLDRALNKDWRSVEQAYSDQGIAPTADGEAKEDSCAD